MSLRMNRARVSGFSIVEVLVALVILGVGMLGIAALYVNTLRSSGSAISRMQAVNLASDIADRIRANGEGKSAYNFDSSTQSGANRSCIGGSTNCSPGDMAATDLFFWKQQISNTLPGGAYGVIAYDGSGSPNEYTINVFWREPGENEMLSYRLVAQL